MINLNLHLVQCLSIALLMFPLIGSIIMGLGCKYLSNKITSIISLFCITISALITICFLWGFFINDFQAVDSVWYVWGTFGNIQCKFGFLLDKLNVVMLSLVAIMSLIIQTYSIRYMQNDLSYARFFSYISFFTFSMLFLVIANNFLQLFFGWELVGLASYLLINFWFKQELPNLAAFKAFIINRIGDCGLLLGIAAILKWCGSLDYIIVFQNLSQSTESINIICGLLFLAAIAKSAQIPLHVWLPDAMQGPIPVSALIHSATMVTAGIFMLARMSPILEHSEYWLNIILLLGVSTNLLIGILAIMSNDIKKIIAYSTISQLGLMMAAIGVSAYSVGIFHLINHAAFKGLLFLAAGSVILIINQSENIHEFPSGLKKHLPITYWSMLIASLSISGFPGFSGFFSKDLILQSVQLSYLPFAENAYYLLILSGAITSFYSFRLFFVIFHKNTSESTGVITSPIISSKIINTPIIILAGFSVILSSLIIPIINNKLFASSILVLPEHDVIKDFYEHDFIGVFKMFLQGFIGKSGMCSFLGIIMALIFYVYKPSLSRLVIEKIKNNFLFLYKLLQHQYFFNDFNKIITIIFQGFAKIFSDIIDKLLIDKILTNSTSNIVIFFSKTIQKLQTGYLYNYIFFTLSGVLIILLWLILTTS